MHLTNIDSGLAVRIDKMILLLLNIYMFEFSQKKPVKYLSVYQTSNNLLIINVHYAYRYSTNVCNGSELQYNNTCKNIINNITTIIDK